MLRLYARLPASSLASARLRGYTGAEIAWSDIGEKRGQLPTKALCDVLDEQRLRLCLRLSSQPTNLSSAPADHIEGLRHKIDKIDGEFGDRIDLVQVDIAGRKWGLAECVQFVHGLVGLREAHRAPVTLTTARTYCGAAESIDKVLQTAASNDIRIALDPAPWMGGPTEQTQDTDYDYLTHVDHLNLSPGWSPWPAPYWSTVHDTLAASMRRSADTSAAVTLPTHVGLAEGLEKGLDRHPFESMVRIAFEHAAKEVAGEGGGREACKVDALREIESLGRSLPTANSQLFSFMKKAPSTNQPAASSVAKETPPAATPQQPPPPPSPPQAAAVDAEPMSHLVERAKALISTKTDEVEVLRGLLAENEQLRAEVQRLQRQQPGPQQPEMPAASYTPSPAEGARGRPKKDSTAKFANRPKREWALDPKKIQPAHWVNLIPTEEQKEKKVVESKPEARTGSLGHLDSFIRMPGS